MLLEIKISTVCNYHRQCLIFLAGQHLHLFGYSYVSDAPEASYTKNKLSLYAIRYCIHHEMLRYSLKNAVQPPVLM